MLILGLLLASMAMMLVLCKARRDNTLRRYNYQAGNKNEIFAWGENAVFPYVNWRVLKPAFIFVYLCI